jgi:hypothetical protein
MVYNGSAFLHLSEFYTVFVVILEVDAGSKAVKVAENDGITVFSNSSVGGHARNHIDVFAYNSACA